MGKKISKVIKDLGFTFSFRRLKRAILLLVLFIIIGVCVYIMHQFGTSESGLKMLYEKEVSSKVDLGDTSVIRIHKKDINGDNMLDYVFITGEEKRSNDVALNSTLELYKNVSFFIVDRQTNDVLKYDTGRDYKSEVTLKIVEDSSNRYYLISDYNGNIDLLKVKGNKIIDITKNTAKNELLGYEINTQRDEENLNLVNITLDNYEKSYLKEYKETKTLDFSSLSVDITKYRDTYLRDKISKCEFQDIDGDGILEFVTTQYILYSLDDSTKENKTIGKVEIYYNIKEDKLKFNKVEINI